MTEQRTLNSALDELDREVRNAISEHRALKAERDRLKAVLESIANNRLSIDVPPEEKPDHDYAQGWDALVTAAREATTEAKKA